MNTPSTPFARFSAIAALFAVGASFVSAANYTWTPSTGGNWDTSTINWNDGAGPVAWTNGNAAVFNAFAAGSTIAVTTNITATSINTNGGATIVMNGVGSIDVTTINTAGATGSSGSIDLFNKITGAHDLTVNSTGTGGAQGRLNIKGASDYTGDTFLTGTAYLLSDNVTNALPTGTTLNMSSGSTFRLGKNGITQEIAGLAGAGLVTVTTTTNTLTINTKLGVTTTYAGSINSSSGFGLTITGSGTQALNGASMTFNGATRVSGGALSLGNSLSATSSVTVDGGVLTSSVANVNLGTGAVTMSSGEISARGAAAAGTFTLSANQAFSTTGGKLTFNIGTGLDQIKGSGTGTFSIGSGTEIALITGAGFSYANTYSLLNGFASGSVSSTGVNITGYDTTNYIASLSNAGVLSFSASAVPEPSTYAFLGGVAALGFVVVRRRLAKKA